MSRLSHRIGFGPRPGEFERILSLGFDRASKELLSAVSTYNPDQARALGLSDLGTQPKPNTPEIVEYAEKKRFQLRTMTLWWLDQMVELSNPFIERMTWFWHGHWATSYAKVDEPLVMFEHVNKLRKNAIGNFEAMSRDMVLDGALIFWLDGQRNTALAPNENLSRELMELFILGVNRYTESDVKETAKALTGYKVQKSSGLVTRNVKQVHKGAISFLGTSGSFDALSLTEFLVKRSDCQRFIPERLFYRFVTSNAVLDGNSRIEGAFSSREILPTIQALVASSYFQAPENSQVRSPIEWLIGILRAIRVTPSKFERPDYLINLLNGLGQRPFFPPNVGGWPADEAWLSAASTQTRISAAEYLMKQGDLSPISQLPQSARVDGLANWLGISSWSERTKLAFSGAIKDPQRLAVLAVCSPEYLVNA
ncbi:MAG: DUF1800 domain-containing protein [Candidatus Nanopelagicaceae bacterium]|nr:DUF1800 domain-containing protein [Candidatus Nanopelagicaceae bacterium]